MANFSSRSGKARSVGRGEKTPLLPPGLVLFLKRRAVEAGGIAMMAVGFALLVTLLTYDRGDPSWNTAAPVGDEAAVRNALGVPGAHVADVLIQTLGMAGYGLGLVIAVWGLRITRHQGLGKVALRIVLALAGVLFAAAALARVPAFAGWPIGTHLGGSAGILLLNGIGWLFGGLLGAAAYGVGALVAGLTATGLIAASLGFSLDEWRRGFASVGWLFGAAGRGARGAAAGFGRSGLTAGLTAVRAARDAGGLLRREPRFDAAEDDGIGGRAAPRRRIEADDDVFDREDEITPEADIGPDADTEDNGRRARVMPVVSPKPKPIEPGRRATTAKQPALELLPNADYELPPHDLLQLPDVAGRPSVVNEEALQRNAEILEGVLGDFGVRGEIVKVHPGPVVTLYELEPAPGTKSSRVIGLADDIARSMSAVSVRVAVVPGRNVIGIELPNAKRETVYLRELLASEAYERTAGKLALVLGKDIGGGPVIADLARMPHLLVAGTTGSGKSVAINTMILSLLYRLPPERCRFIMIDPKMLELSVYEGIPHLLAPVVTDPKKAVVALKWTVREMEDRYRSMSKLGVRNIEGYNARLREARKTGEVLTRRVQTGFDPDTGKPIFEEQPIDLTELPYIVVIVDEMADLMLVAGKDIEAAIQRLAQMARAAGIHLIMATQRPSVDVITGTIKANFPTRISFQVTSKIDSRTILGEQGAEQLLGQGDMLHMAGGGRITRVHGPFVRDDEVEQVVNFLKAQGEPAYIDAVTEDDDEMAAFDDGAMGGGRGGSGDDLYDQAVALVCRERKASTSFVQRHLQIGYNRAARLIERMEQEGVVSQANHVGKREVLARNIDDVAR